MSRIGIALARAQIPNVGWLARPCYYTRCKENFLHSRNLSVEYTLHQIGYTRVQSRDDNAIVILAALVSPSVKHRVHENVGNVYVAIGLVLDTLNRTTE